MHPTIKSLIGKMESHESSGDKLRNEVCEKMTDVYFKTRLTQVEIAKRMGVTHGYVHMLLHGERPWTKALLIKFSQVINL